MVDLERKASRGILLSETHNDRLNGSLVLDKDISKTDSFFFKKKQSLFCHLNFSRHAVEWQGANIFHMKKVLDNRSQLILYCYYHVTLLLHQGLGGRWLLVNLIRSMWCLKLPSHSYVSDSVSVREGWLTRPGSCCCSRHDRSRNDNTIMLPRMAHACMNACICRHA